MCSCSYSCYVSTESEKIKGMWQTDGMQQLMWHLTEGHKSTYALNWFSRTNVHLYVQYYRCK